MFCFASNSVGRLWNAIKKQNRSDEVEIYPILILIYLYLIGLLLSLKPTWSLEVAKDM